MEPEFVYVWQQDGVITIYVPYHPGTFFSERGPKDFVREVKSDSSSGDLLSAFKEADDFCQNELHAGSRVSLLDKPYEPRDEESCFKFADLATFRSSGR